jgi:hypothetical protein
MNIGPKRRNGTKPMQIGTSNTKNDIVAFARLPACVTNIAPVFGAICFGVSPEPKKMGVMGRQPAPATKPAKQGSELWGSPPGSGAFIWIPNWPQCRHSILPSSRGAHKHASQRWPLLPYNIKTATYTRVSKKQRFGHLATFWPFNNDSRQTAKPSSNGRRWSLLVYIYIYII